MFLIKKQFHNDHKHLYDAVVESTFFETVGLGFESSGRLVLLLFLFLFLLANMSVRCNMKKKLLNFNEKLE
jgi:hypothetical protein